MAKTIKELEDLIRKTQEEREALVKPLDNKINRYYAMIKSLENKSVSTDKSLGNLIRLAGTNDKAYRALWDTTPRGINPSGYRDEDKQACFQLYLKQASTDGHKEIATFILRDLFPILKTKEISILRHDCGEDGSWVLTWTDDCEWVIHDVYSYDYRYGSKTPCFRSNNLIDTLRHIAFNHWGTK